MADPKLVAYLRQNVPKYGEQPIKDKLIEEGLTETEVDEALAVAIKPERKKKPTLVIALGFSIFVIGAVLVFFSLEKPVPATGGVERPAVGGAEPGTAPPPSAPVVPKGPLLGHYGWMLQVPPGYATQTAFKDLGNRTEVVYFFPEGTDPTNFVNEGLYGQLGIMRLEVSPLRIAQGTIDIDSLRGGITQTLNKRGDTYELKDTSAGGLRGFVVRISSPFPLTQAFVVGSKVMYVLTSGVDEPKFQNLLQGLTEVSPHDRPAGN